jgi:GTPase SAR1 family protein
MYYRNSNGIIIVYDVTNGESFAHTKSWIDEVKNNCGENDALPIVLVGNKCDLPNRIVTVKDQEDYAKLMNMPFFEASAKENINIEEVFVELAKLMMERQEKNNAAKTSDNNNGIVLGKVPGGKKNDLKRSCCNK